MKVRFLLCCLIIYCAGASAERMIIRVAPTASTLPSIPPIVWYDQCQKQPSGSYWHLLFRALRELGYQPQWADIDYPSDLNNYLDWQKLLFKKLNAGEADIAIFSEAVKDSTLIAGQSPVVIFNEILTISKLLPKPKTLNDVSPYVGAMLPSTADNLHKLGDNIKLHFDIFNTVPDMFAALANDEVDYVISSNKLGKVFIRKEAMTHKVNTLDLGVITLQLYPAMPNTPANQQLLIKLDKKINQYRQENLIEQIENTYMKQWLNHGNCDPHPS